MQIRPGRATEGKILVEVLKPEQESAGGIVIPDSAQENPPLGRVCSVGPGEYLESGERADLGVEVGDIVLFDPESPMFRGTYFKNPEGREYAILTARVEALMVLDDDEARP